jgi:hypothetical protein
MGPKKTHLIVCEAIACCLCCSPLAERPWRSSDDCRKRTHTLSSSLVNGSVLFLITTLRLSFPRHQGSEWRMLGYRNEVRVGPASSCALAQASDFVSMSVSVSVSTSLSFRSSSSLLHSASWIRARGRSSSFAVPSHKGSNFSHITLSLDATFSKIDATTMWSAVESQAARDEPRDGGADWRSRWAMSSWN